MIDFSKALFVLFVFVCFFWIAFMLDNLKHTKYKVLDRHSMEEHKVFNNKWDAEKYVREYKEFHNYLIQEVKVK